MSKSLKRKCPACGKMKSFRADVKTCGCIGTASMTSAVANRRAKPEISPEKVVEIELQKLRHKKESEKSTIEELQERLINLEDQNAAFLELKKSKPNVITIVPKVATGKSESVAVIVWSDWHIEETILPEQVSGMNEFNASVCDRRFQNLLNGGMAWLNIEKSRTNIKTVILALLGDFITGSIHEDLAEGNGLPPAMAIHKAYSMIISGIKFMLANTPKDVTFEVPCHSGNHGRMTKDQRIATEAGNSLEYFMYLMLQDYFQDEKRLTFTVQPGYHSYANVFEGGYRVRFHHGHQINYSGGVGGISIPVNKAIAQWNKAKSVDLDVFGHFHTQQDGGNWICNGCLIGYSPYGVSIKGSYQPPQQTFFLINREYAAKTAVAPIFVEGPKW